MPERVKGLAIAAGHPLEEPDLPSLDIPGSASAWREWRGDGPLYLRFDEGDLPLDAVQRISQTGEVWVDARPKDIGDVLDLAFSGASRVVVEWGDLDEEDLEEAMEGMDLGLIIAAPADAIDKLPASIDVLLRSDAEAVMPEGVDVYRPDGSDLRRVANGRPADVDGEEE